MADQSNAEMGGEAGPMPEVESQPQPAASLEAEAQPEAQPEAMAEPEPCADGAPAPQGRPGRGGRERGPGGGRELGGFRIRLSENEQRAAQLVQESFQLRSTVAALGFSIRTVAQLLEEGKLEELVAQQRALGGGRSRTNSPATDHAREGSREPVPVRRLERGERRGEGRQDQERRGGRPDPFARPSRPQPAPPPVPVDDTPLVEVAPLLDGAGEAILPVTIEPQP